jgi:hypothetical protein
MDRYPDAIADLPMSQGPDGTRAYWAAERDMAVLDTQEDFAAPKLMPGQTLLKEGRQRFIFVDPGKAAGAVIKLFPLSLVFSKLKHSKYAYREFSNMQLAGGRGIPVPRAIAFLEKRRRGLVVCSGLVQENLVGSADLKALFDAGKLTQPQLIEHASVAVQTLYEAGVNHVDLRDENVMLDPSNGRWSVIDWQYASFVDPRAPWLLEYLLGYFILLSPAPWRAELLEGWTMAMHTRCGHDTDPETFRSHVAHVAQRRKSLRQRIGLTPLSA